MKGLGIDLCSISKMSKILEKTPGFLNRFYAPEERAYLDKRGVRKAESAAAMYAAKEAFLKAIGTGIGGEALLNEIIVLHNELGKPCYHLEGAAKAALEKLDAKVAALSLTHEEGMAAAVCILE